MWEIVVLKTVWEGRRVRYGGGGLHGQERACSLILIVRRVDSSRLVNMSTSNAHLRSVHSSAIWKDMSKRTLGSELAVALYSC